MPDSCANGLALLGCTVLYKEEVYFAFPLRIGEESQRRLGELTRQPWACNRELRLCAAAVYIYETGDLYIIEAAFPELATDSVAVEVEGADLVVRRQPVRPQSGDRRGSELRRIPLPPWGDETTLVIRFDHGVLHATIRHRNPTDGL